MNLVTMIYVSDMDRSVNFYRDIVGLKLRFQSPGWSEFDVDGTTLALHGGAKTRSGGRDLEMYAATVGVGFNVSDLDARCAALRAKGVRFVMEPAERPGEGIRLAVFLDPDGLGVSLAQTVAAAGGH